MEKIDVLDATARRIRCLCLRAKRARVLERWGDCERLLLEAERLAWLLKLAHESDSQKVPTELQVLANWMERMEERAA